MKSFKTAFFAFLLTSFSLFASAQTGALKGKKATLHNYMFAIDESFQMNLEDLLEEDPVTHLPDYNEVEALFKGKTYERIEAAIESHTGLEILPVDALQGKVLYDVYDFPAGSRKKAAKAGDTPYYLKLNVQMMPRDVAQDELEVNSTSMEKRRIKPIITIKATMANKKGKSLYTVTGKAKGDRWITLEQVSLWGFIHIEGQDIIDEENTLMSVLDEAIEDLKANWLK